MLPLAPYFTDFKVTVGTMQKLWAVAILCVSCASDPPPSCSQAVGHYYDVAGCTFVGTNGTRTSKAEAGTTCFNIATAVPSQCQDKFDAWLFCVDDTPAQATTPQCDCSQSYQELITCR